MGGKIGFPGYLRTNHQRCSLDRFLIVISCRDDQDVLSGSVLKGYPGTRLQPGALRIPSALFRSGKGFVGEEIGRIPLSCDGRNLKIFIIAFQEIVQAWSWGKRLLVA